MAVTSDGPIEQKAAPGDIGDRSATGFVAQVIGASDRGEEEVVQSGPRDPAGETARGA
jgi:ABC-type Fe3+/spermidine/putrescine transport system ATPase subunit